jgi:hypothetical protein
MELSTVVRIIISVFLLIFGCVIVYIPNYYSNSSDPDLTCAKIIFDTNVCDRIKNDYRIIGAILITLATICLGMEIYKNVLHT